jgi:hypothetical protein
VRPLRDGGGEAHRGRAETAAEMCEVGGVAARPMTYGRYVQGPYPDGARPPGDDVNVVRKATSWQ